MADLQKLESLYSGFNRVFTGRRVATFAQQLIPYFKPGLKILDVGCGHGAIAIDMAKNYVPDAKIQALDMNESWLDTARKTAKSEEVNNIEWMTGDACDLSRFEDEQFDIVHAHQVVLHVLQPVKALQEMRRVCKTGGIVTVRDSAGALFLPESPDLARCLDLSMEASVKRGASGYGGRLNYQWAHEAGYAWPNIEASSVGWEYHGAEAREQWYQGRDGMIGEVLKAGLGTEEDRQKFEDAWARWLNNPAARLMGLDSVLVCHK